jgi:transposase
MSRFIEGEERSQSVLFRESPDEWITEDNPVRVVDAFVEELDLAGLGSAKAEPAETGRPAYHPATLLKIYVYGYLNRIQSSRRLEREAQCNVELIWLTARLMPDFKTIADFRRDNGNAIRRVCAQFIALCRKMNLFSEAMVAVDSSKFKAVNHRDRNFTKHKIKVRLEHLASLQRTCGEARSRTACDAGAGRSGCMQRRITPPAQRMRTAGPQADMRDLKLID